MNATRKPLTPEILVPRLGDYLIERGLITPAQLDAALQKQAEIRMVNPSAPLIGQLMVEMGYLSQSDLDQVITEHVLQLRQALTDYSHQLEQRVQERTSELEEALNRLSELNQLKSNFVANISHELRPPLPHLKGYLDLLASGDFGELNPEQATTINTIQKSTGRLERLIDDLILFASSERSRLEITPKKVDLGMLCREVCEQMQAKAKDQRVSLELTAPPDLLFVHADSEKIGWVVHQFIDNALKFTPAGGSVVVELIPEAMFTRVSVRDNGIGIPENRLREIFEPFHQLDGSSTRKYGGTGLGLSLAQKIIDAHNSTIIVTSDLGKGSQFSFKLKNVTEGII
jgi:signal transduction histidine kinase